MKHSLLICGLTAATIMIGLSSNRAGAAPVQAGALASVTTAAPSDVTPANWRGRGYYRPGFALYLGGPGPRCWWSHRWHRRVCSYY